MPGSSAVTNDLLCKADVKWAENSTSSSTAWFGKPLLGIDSLYACAKLCDVAPLCTAFLHNRYKKCYLLKRAPRRIERDDVVHKSLACRLLQKAAPIAWKALVTVLAKRSSLHPMHRYASQAIDQSAAPLLGSKLPFDVFVVNLNASTSRLSAAQRQLARASIQSTDWRRHLGVLGSDLDHRALQRAGLVLEGQAANNVACALSHYVLWAALAKRAATANRSIAAEDATTGSGAGTSVEPFEEAHEGRVPRGRSALVLEDDALLEAGFLRAATQMLERCDALRYDLCHLYWNRHLTRPACVVPVRHHGPPGAPELVRLSCRAGLVPGTVAYFISPAGAVRALERGLPIRDNIDLQLGVSSPTLRWFALAREKSLARHDFSVKSVRVHGEQGSR